MSVERTGVDATTDGPAPGAVAGRRTTATGRPMKEGRRAADVPEGTRHRGHRGDHMAEVESTHRCIGNTTSCVIKEWTTAYAGRNRCPPRPRLGGRRGHGRVYSVRLSLRQGNSRTDHAGGRCSRADRVTPREARCRDHRASARSRRTTSRASIGKDCREAPSTGTCGAMRTFPGR